MTQQENPQDKYRLYGIDTNGDRHDLGVFSDAEYAGVWDLFDELYESVETVVLT